MSKFIVSFDEMSAVFTPDRGAPVRLVAERREPREHRCSDCYGFRGGGRYGCVFPFNSACVGMVGRRHPGKVVWKEVPQ